MQEQQQQERKPNWLNYHRITRHFHISPVPLSCPSNSSSTTKLTSICISTRAFMFCGFSRLLPFMDIWAVFDRKGGTMSVAMPPPSSSLLSSVPNVCKLAHIYIEGIAHSNCQTQRPPPSVLLLSDLTLHYYFPGPVQSTTVIFVRPKNPIASEAAGEGGSVWNVYKTLQTQKTAEWRL